MDWYCSHCLRSCATMRQGDFISCSECGKVLGECRRVKSRAVGSKRVQIRRKMAAGNPADDDSNGETEEESSSSSR